MLVLSRQRDETIIIGDDIEVTVVDIRGDKVRLGITAPREISVHRKEVYEAIRRENRVASQVKPEDLPGFIKLKGGKDVPKEPGEERFSQVVEVPVPTKPEVKDFRPPSPPTPPVPARRDGYVPRRR